MIKIKTPQTGCDRRLVFSPRVRLAVLILCSVLLSGCMGPTEIKVQGRWLFEEPHLKNLNAESHLTLTWVFDGGFFRHYACCFNIDMEVSGRYRVKEVQGDVITIELYDVQGSASRFEGEIRIVVSPDDDTLNIQGSGPFSRIQ